VAYSIVTRVYKGHMFIESRVGAGTTVHLYLPRAQRVNAPEPAAKMQVKGGSETILAADDEEIVRKFGIVQKRRKVVYTFLSILMAFEHNADNLVWR